MTPDPFDLSGAAQAAQQQFLQMQEARLKPSLWVRFWKNPITKGFYGTLLALAFAAFCWRMYQTDQLTRAAVGWINQQVAASQQRQGLAPKPVQPAP